MAVDQYRVRISSAGGPATDALILGDGTTLTLGDGTEFDLDVGTSGGVQEIIVPASSTLQAVFSGLVDGVAYNVTVEAHDSLGYGPAATATVTPQNVPTVTAPSALPALKVGVAASTTMQATGGTQPYTWSQTGLPAGLTLNASTGAITGTPTTSGPYSTTITVTDAVGGTASQTYTGTVTTSSTLNIISPASLPNGQVGVAYSPVTVSASGGTTPYAWSATGLPPGLTINASTGVISGTPTTAGSYTPSVTVNDAASGTDTQPYSMTVAAGSNALTITGPASLPNGTVGTAYPGQLVTASGGSTPYHYSATGLPPGLTCVDGSGFSAGDGVIAGTPTATGNFTVTVKVTDATNATATKVYAMSVAASGGAVLLAVNDPAQPSSISWATFIGTNGVQQNRPVTDSSGDNGAPVQTYELQGFRQDHVRLEQGHLAMYADGARVVGGNTIGSGMTTYAQATKNFIGAMVQTGGALTVPAPIGFQFKFGHLEFDYMSRLRGPGGLVAASGLWPELRLESRQGNTFGWPPEVDVMDYLTNVGVISAGVKLGAAFNDGNPLDIIARTRGLAPLVSYANTFTVPLTNDPTRNSPPAWDGNVRYPIGATVLYAVGGVFHTFTSKADAYNAQNVGNAPPNATWWTDNGTTTPLFDATGTNDVGDSLIYWINLMVPDGPSATVHNRVLIPPTYVDKNGATKRTVLRNEGSVNAAMNINNAANITIDGGGTPGNAGADGAQLQSFLKLAFGFRCATRAGATEIHGHTSVDGHTTPNTTTFGSPIVIAGVSYPSGSSLTTDGAVDGNGNPIPGFSGFDSSWLGKEISIDPNRAIDIIAASWVAGSPTTATFTTRTPHGLGVGSHVTIQNIDSSPGNLSANWNTQVNVATVIDATHFTVHDPNVYQTDPGPYGPLDQGPRGQPADHNGQVFVTTRYHRIVQVISPTQIMYSPSGIGDFGNPNQADPNLRKPCRWTTMPRCQLNGQTGAPTPNGSDNTNTVDPSNIGEWQVAYVPSLNSATRDAVLGYQIITGTGNTGSNANGDAADRSITGASNTSGGRQHWKVTNGRQFRFVRLQMSGSHQQFGFPGGYDPNNEAQNAIWWAGGTDCEVGDCTVDHMWGNSMETFARSGPNNTNIFQNGLWVHDCVMSNFGRQAFSFALGINIIIEHTLMHGSSRTIIDLEPVAATYATRDARAADLVDGYNMIDNTIGHHGLGGMVSFHYGIANILLRGNQGEGIGSGATWQGANMIVTDNIETGIPQTSGPNQPNIVNSYYAFIYQTGAAGQPVGGKNVYVHRNHNTTGRNMVEFDPDGAPVNWSVGGNDSWGGGTSTNVVNQSGNALSAPTFDGSWMAGVGPRAHVLRDAQWRTAALDWNATSLAFSIDGVNVWTYSGTHVPQIAMYLTFQLAVVGAGAPAGMTPANNTAETGDWTFGAEFRINRLLVLASSGGAAPAPANLVDAAGNFLVDASGNQLVTG